MKHLTSFLMVRLNSLLLAGVLLCFPAHASDAVDNLQKALAAQKWPVAGGFALQLVAQMNGQLDPKVQSQLRAEGFKEGHRIAQFADVNALFAEFKAARAQSQTEAAYRLAQIIMNVCFKRYTDSDPMPEFFEAQARHASSSSFDTAYALALAAYRAKRFDVAMQAAEDAWVVRDSTPASRIAPEGAYMALQTGAISAIELGRFDAAESLLIRSVQEKNKNWVRRQPDFRPVAMLLQHQERQKAINYLEACLNINWPGGKDQIETLLAQIRGGETPAIR